MIAQGPVASQEAIKMLGTNGGGFFNANSAHPFENPTPSNQLHTDHFDLCHSGRSDLHVRRDGGRPTARLGDLRRLRRDVPGGRILLLLGRTEGQPNACQTGRRDASD